MNAVNRRMQIDLPLPRQGSSVERRLEKLTDVLTHRWPYLRPHSSRETIFARGFPRLGLHETALGLIRGQLRHGHWLPLRPVSLVFYVFGQCWKKCSKQLLGLLRVVPRCSPVGLFQRWNP